MHRSAPRRKHILLVEDNAGDARLVSEAIKDFTTPVELHHEEDCDAALSFIHRADPIPDLVLLDINLPVGDGKAVLAEIKNNPNTWAVPVLVLTTSDAPKDVSKAYELGANAYLRKPVDVGRFLEMMEVIERFWLGMVVR